MISNYCIIFGILSFIAAVYDFTFYRIPNILILLILITLIFKITLTSSKEEFYTSSFIAIISLLIGYIFYLLKRIGAGDAKFIAVSLAWISIEQIPLYLIFVSILGGALAVFYATFPEYIDSIRLKIYNYLKSMFIKNYFILKPYLDQPFHYSQHKSWRKISIPYGMSIAMGNILTILMPLLSGKL